MQCNSSGFSAFCPEAVGTRDLIGLLLNSALVCFLPGSGLRSALGFSLDHGSDHAWKAGKEWSRSQLGVEELGDGLRSRFPLRKEWGGRSVPGRGPGLETWRVRGPGRGHVGDRARLSEQQAGSRVPPAWRAGPAGRPCQLPSLFSAEPRAPCPCHPMAFAPLYRPPPEDSAAAHASPALPRLPSLRSPLRTLHFHCSSSLFFVLATLGVSRIGLLLTRLPWPKHRDLWPGFSRLSPTWSPRFSLSAFHKDLFLARQPEGACGNRSPPRYP